eukprot:m51a1_g6073 hypothetical protein (688) ;mRNA; r:287203-290630
MCGVADGSHTLDPAAEERYPLLLCCGHSVCASCAHSGPELRCAACSQDSREPALGYRKNYLLALQIEAERSRSPASPSRRTCANCEACEATVWCASCSVVSDGQAALGASLCAACDAASHATRLSSTHARVPLARRPPPAPRCPAHPQRPADLYCPRCAALLCDLCRDYGRHADHRDALALRAAAAGDAAAHALAAAPAAARAAAEAARRVAEVEAEGQRLAASAGAAREAARAALGRVREAAAARCEALVAEIDAAYALALAALRSQRDRVALAGAEATVAGAAGTRAAEDKDDAELLGGVLQRLAAATQRAHVVDAEPLAASGRVDAEGLGGPTLDALCASISSLGRVVAGEGPLPATSSLVAPTPPMPLVAVSGNGSYGHKDGPGALSQFRGPLYLAQDPTDGGLFVSDHGNHVIRKVLPDGTTKTVAGMPGQMGFVDRVAAVAAKLSGPAGLAYDRKSGCLYIADSCNNRIRALSPDGQLTTLCGSGVKASVDGPALQCAFKTPWALCVCPRSGDLLVGERSGPVRRVSHGPHGPAVETVCVAGVPKSKFRATGIMVDPVTSSIVVCECAKHRVCAITPEGEMRVLAGKGTEGPAARSAALFGSPYAACADASGTLYVADSEKGEVRRITPQGVVGTLTLSPKLSGPTGLLLVAPGAAAEAAGGTLYVVEQSAHRVSRVALQS